MLTFHNDPQIKEKYLTRLKAHAAADEIIQGTGWGNGKGCAIGCTLEKYDHKAFETELGIPEWLARLEDKIFKGLRSAEAKNFPVDFLEAVPVGVELGRVKWKFLVFILEENVKTIAGLKIPEAWKDKIFSANSSVIAVLKPAIETGSLDFEALRLARAAAAYAADAAADAAYAAADARYEKYKLFAAEILRLLRDAK